MSDAPSYECMNIYSKHLKLDMSGGELAEFAAEHCYSADQVNAVLEIMHYLDDKKHKNTIDTLLRLSKLPTKVPKTFESYDFTRVHGKDVEMLKKPICIVRSKCWYEHCFYRTTGSWKDTPG